MLLVANLANTKWWKKHGKMTETQAYGYSSESADSGSYPMNTNIKGLRWFSKIKIFASCVLCMKVNAWALDGLELDLYTYYFRWELPLCLRCPLQHPLLLLWPMNHYL